MASVRQTDRHQPPIVGVYHLRNLEAHLMISLAKVAARYPRALVEELEDSPDGFLIFEDAPFEFTAWRRNQPLPTNLSERKE